MHRVRLTGNSVAPLLLDLVLEGRVDFVGAFVVSPPLRSLLSAVTDGSVPFIHVWTVQEFLPRMTDGNALALPLLSPRDYRIFWGLRRLLDADTSDARFEWLREDRQVSFWGPNDFWADPTDVRFDIHIGFKSFGGIEVPEPGLPERLRHLVAWLNCMCAPGVTWWPCGTTMFLLPPIEDLDEIEREAWRVVTEEANRAAANMSWWTRTFGGQAPPIAEDARARFKELRDRVIWKLLVLAGGISEATDDTDDQKH